MNPLGNPARDIILAADERHFAAMERGSCRLRLAIEQYHAGTGRRFLVGHKRWQAR